MYNPYYTYKIIETHGLHLLSRRKHTSTQAGQTNTQSECEQKEINNNCLTLAGNSLRLLTHSRRITTRIIRQKSQTKTTTKKNIQIKRTRLSLIVRKNRRPLKRSQIVQSWKQMSANLKKHRLIARNIRGPGLWHLRQRQKWFPGPAVIRQTDKRKRQQKTQPETNQQLPLHRRQQQEQKSRQTIALSTL